MKTKRIMTLILSVAILLVSCSALGGKNMATTPNIGLTQIADGDNFGFDTINSNNTLIDTAVGSKVTSAYGGLYQTSISYYDITASALDTFYDISKPMTEYISKDFDLQDGYKFKCLNTGTYFFSYWIFMVAVTGDSSIIITPKVNTGVLTQGQIKINVDGLASSSAHEIKNGSSGIVTLNANDTINLCFSSHNTTGVFSVYRVCFNIFRIG